jgi:tellurite resistance protein TerC
VLAFAGVKLVLSETPAGKLPIPVALGVIIVVLADSIIWSLATSPNTNDDAIPPTATLAPEQQTDADATTAGITASEQLDSRNAIRE